MATETLIFMPNGDVTLTLTRYVLKEDENQSRNLTDPSKPPARPTTKDDELLETATDVEAELEALAAEEEESVLFFAPDPPDVPDAPTSPPPLRARRGSNASSRRDRSESPPASFWATLKRQAATVPEAVSDEPPPPPAKKPERIVISSHEVHCIVSSRHMMLASRYFETILGGDFPHAITLRTRGHVTIPVDEDLDSMIILLHIIHGAGRKVPRQISLDQLSKLAILVSKFELLSTVEFFSDTWIDNLQRGGLPKTYNENVLPLVYVFWVFDRPDEFRDMTRLAQRETTENLEDDVRDMPILHGIIDAIKRDREFAIETAITIVQALIDRYMAGQAICDSALDDELRYACDSMVLGCLMTSSRRIGIWPKPTTPFAGKKFKELVKAIRGIRILDVCNKTSSRRWNSHGPSPNCHGLEDSIEASMKNIEAGLDGLALADYPKEPEDYSLLLKAYLPPPLVEFERDQPTKDNLQNLQIYMREEMTAQPKEAAAAPQQSPVPSLQFTSQFNASNTTEHSKQDFTAPSPRFLPHHESPTVAEVPKQDLLGAASFFSKRIDSQTLEASPKQQDQSQSPRTSHPINFAESVESIERELPTPPTPPTRFSAGIHSPQTETFPNQEDAAPPPRYSSQFESRNMAESAKQDNSAPATRFSPPIQSSPAAAYSPQQVRSPPSPILARSNTNPFRPSEPQSPKQEIYAPAPRVSSQFDSKLSEGIRQDFSAPSPRYSPRVEALKEIQAPKPQNPTNGAQTHGARPSLKDFLRSTARDTDEAGQESVKVAPAPRKYSPSQEYQKNVWRVNRAPISGRVGDERSEEPVKNISRATPSPSQSQDEEIKRLSTNSPPPVQKFRTLGNSKTTSHVASDSEQSARDIQRAPSVISNLSIDELLMDVQVPQNGNGVRQSIESKGREVKNTMNANGNGYVFTGTQNGNGNGNGYGNANGNGTNTSQTTSEADDAWTPPKVFKMKKSKKTFSTRF